MSQLISTSNHLKRERKPSSHEIVSRLHRHVLAYWKKTNSLRIFFGDIFFIKMLPSAPATNRLTPNPSNMMNDNIFLLSRFWHLRIANRKSRKRRKKHTKNVHRARRDVHLTLERWIHVLAERFHKVFWVVHYNFVIALENSETCQTKRTKQNKTDLAAFDGIL